MGATLQGLPPVIDRRARVLILGSFPSTAALAAQQYYAHPQNRFWRILGAVIGQPLKEMDYATQYRIRWVSSRSRRRRYAGSASTAAWPRAASVKSRQWASKPWCCPRPARPMRAGRSSGGWTRGGQRWRKPAYPVPVVSSSRMAASRSACAMASAPNTAWVCMTAHSSAVSLPG